MSHKRQMASKEAEALSRKLGPVDEAQGGYVGYGAGEEHPDPPAARDACGFEMTVRKKQCKACPWKVSTVPERDIPNGYSQELHERLRRTIAEPGDCRGSTRIMACHEHPPGGEVPCVGWVINQLGPGNNIGLRILALDGRFRDLEVDGPQHRHFEDTLPKREKKNQ